MKKVLLTITAFCAAVSLNAQTLINGGFEDAMTANPSFVNVHLTNGWFALINGGPDASAFEGSQAAQLVTATDPALNTALTWGDDNITGIAQQIYEGPIADPANVTVSFMYKFASVGGDVGFVQVAIYDTLGTGATDDVALYFDNIEFTADQANWTQVDFTMTATGNPGTANLMAFIAVSSEEGYFVAGSPNPGTTLWLDDVQLSTGTSGIEEVEGFNLTVYPNPAGDVLNIKTTGVASNVSIISLDGKVISTQVMNGTFAAVNVADLQAGAYFYQVTAEDGSVVTNTFMKK